MSDQNALDRAGLTPSERDDLTERLHRAIGSLGEEANRKKGTEFWRLKGKADGVALALSYMEEYGHGR